MLGRPHSSGNLLALGFWLLIACLLPQLRAAELDLSGIYQGHAPAADAARRSFILDLSANGAAAFTTRYIGKGEVVERGRWTRKGNLVTLTFDPMGPNRPPAPLVFCYHRHALNPLHWDPSEWGRTGPPALHRSHTLPGGN